MQRIEQVVVSQLKAHAAVALAVVSVLATPGWLQGAQSADAVPAASERKVVKTSDDLPRYTYRIEGKASELIDNDAGLARLAVEVRRDIESTLQQYDIQDATTLQSHYATLQSIALLEGRFDDALGYNEQIRALESKEPDRLMTGIMLEAVLAARGVAPDEAQRVAGAELEKRLRALPFDTIRELVTQRKASMWEWARKTPAPGRGDGQAECPR